MRAWLSGITGPCQGPVGVSITPARTVLTKCARSSMDRVPVFGTVDVGSIPAERTNYIAKTRSVLSLAGIETQLRFFMNKMK